MNGNRKKGEVEKDVTRLRESLSEPRTMDELVELFGWSHSTVRRRVMEAGDVHRVARVGDGPVRYVLGSSIGLKGGDDGLAET